MSEHCDTAMSHQDSWQPQGRYYLARFPQGEDHER